MNADLAGVILHIDDDRSVRESMALLLGMEGYAMNSAANGPDALELVHAGLEPDVLIADFNLESRMNGAETTEKIQRTLRYAPPVIMLTGDLSAAKIPRVAEVILWMTSKPLDPRVLLAALPGLVQVSRVTRRMPARTR
ncbi:MAG: response regulator [Steroidobacteraceae bacterium]|jgi:CheY-like chemotaxis protein